MSETMKRVDAIEIELKGMLEKSPTPEEEKLIWLALGLVEVARERQEKIEKLRQQTKHTGV